MLAELKLIIVRIAAGPRLCRLVFGLLAAVGAANAEVGDYLGAIPSEKPAWFKESFLEFEYDVAEAATEGRRVMLYFHQDGCPYCARLVSENFTDPAMRAFIVEHFDGIALNLWGDREVVTVGGRGFTEKTFSAALKVQYTPTIIFLDEAGKVALRLDGYYPPADFRAALDYVAGRHEKEASFAAWRRDSLASGEGSLIDEDFFRDDTDLRALQERRGRALAVYFEAPDCVECRTLHERILTDPPTRQLVTQLDNLQFAIGSDRRIVTPAGEATTAGRWAEQLGIAYTPSVVFFDAAGKEVMRIGAFLKTFHFQGVYAYVLEKAYLEEPEFQRYLSARGDRIREAGYDTDIWGYESFHD